MSLISRRSFLAASAGAASLPLWDRLAVAAETDVAIVGAGAAGIAAARRVQALGKRAVILEATDRVGGRCITEAATFGVPFDSGAHWLRSPDRNPVAKLVIGTGFELYPAPPGQKVRIGRRNAREGELEEYLSMVVRARRAIEDASRGKVDMSCAQAMPKEVGEWQPSVEFLLGPLAFGKDFSELSVVDVTRASERDSDAYCRQGFGALLGKLADGLNVQLASPVTRIATLPKGGFTVETGKGALQARVVIVTVSTNLLTEGKLGFSMGAPKRHMDAASRLRLGIYERVALEIPGNPFGLARDDLVFEKADGKRTAALLANVSGTSLSYVDVAGSFGRDLAAKGTREMTAFAIEWLDKLFGADIKKSIKRTQATQWAFSPYVMGAMSAAAPGSQATRRILMEPMYDRVYYAGEAAHETLYGTVGGAWESGERAADTALKALGVVTSSTKPEPQAPPPLQRAPKQKRRR
ncbi:MAG: FAD-dependent oxidoreductase [Pseudorhodoplanes sp.]